MPVPTPAYPSLAEATAAATQIGECLSSGISDGDLLAHIKTHRKEFGHASWVLGGYLRDVTLGMPDGITPIGIESAEQDAEFHRAWSKLVNIHDAETSGAVQATGLPWIQIVIWLLSLLARS